MKKSKLLIPMMVFVMAIGMAFTSKTDEVSTGWIDLNGVATKLDNHPCDNGTVEDCKVTFEDDLEEREFKVFTDASLQTVFTASTGDPYILPKMPE
ncbi:MAG TPA: DUF6520 family protein [Dysgonamonadaceae bacterium]|nr:DUF6520 family protein [Dysgonamonadaceae bacterium]